MAQNDTMWIEIIIPRHLQMPFSEAEIQRHIEYLDSQIRKELEEKGEDDQAKIEEELTQLYMVVLD